MYLILLVGAGRFERPTPCAQGRCATRLRYAPTFVAFLILNYFIGLRYCPAYPKSTHSALTNRDGSRTARGNAGKRGPRWGSDSAPRAGIPAEIRRWPGWPAARRRAWHEGF